MSDNLLTGAVVILGASGGIGGALAAALAADARFDPVIPLSRRRDGLDLADEDAVEAAARNLAAEGAGVALVINATGVIAPDSRGPEKSFSAIDPARMLSVMQVNAVGAALAIKHFGPLLKKDGPAAFASLSARVGSIGDNRLGGWMSYRASKAALNQIVRCAAVEFARSHPQAVFAALHPGTIETNMTRDFARGRYTATADECAERLIKVIEELTPAESGGFFDYEGRKVEW